jgi:hypothetical protein
MLNAIDGTEDHLDGYEIGVSPEEDDLFNESSENEDEMSDN